MIGAEEPDYAGLYLTCVGASGNDPSCDRFFGYLRPVFRRIAQRIASQFAASQDVDDVEQEIYLKVIGAAPAIVLTLPRQPKETIAYFSVVAANAARDFFRARRCTRRPTEQSGIGDAMERLTQDDRALRSLDRAILLSRIEDCLREERREQTIFRLYYRQGFSAREIAGIAGLALTTEGVESVIFRITRQIRKCLSGGSPQRIQSPVKGFRA